MISKEIVPVIPTVGIVVLQDSQVLLVRHGAKAGHIEGTLGIPAGRIEVDNNETTKEAAKRELEEETGYRVDEENIIEFEGNHFQADIPRSDGTIKRMSWDVFIATKIDGDMREGNDETIPEWHDLSNLDELKFLPNVKAAINNAQAFLLRNK